VNTYELVLEHVNDSRKWTFLFQKGMNCLRDNPERIMLT